MGSKIFLLSLMCKWADLYCRLWGLCVLGRVLVLGLVISEWFVMDYWMHSRCCWLLCLCCLDFAVLFR